MFHSTTFEMYPYVLAVSFSNMYIIVRHVVTYGLAVCIIVKPSFAYATFLSFDHSSLALVFNGRHMESDDREEEVDGAALDAQIFTPPQGLFPGGHPVRSINHWEIFIDAAPKKEKKSGQSM